VTAAASTHSLGATVLMVIAVVLLGVVVGIVPVVIVRLVAGGRRSSPARRRPQPRIFEPPREAPAEAPARPRGPIAEPPAADPPPEPLVATPVVAVNERHRDLYDEEYARQVDRVETLRRTIRTRLTVGAQTNEP
jgi:hypothetical protein